MRLNCSLGRAVNVNDGRPDTWLGSPGHEGSCAGGLTPAGRWQRSGGRISDKHAAGTPGGGSASGGLGRNQYRPRIAQREAILENAMGSEDKRLADADSGDEPKRMLPRHIWPLAGRAVGGGPAAKSGQGGQIGPPRNETWRKPSARKGKPKKRQVPIGDDRDVEEHPALSLSPSGFEGDRLRRWYRHF